MPRCLGTRARASVPATLRAPTRVHVRCAAAAASSQVNIWDNQALLTVRCDAWTPHASDPRVSRAQAMLRHGGTVRPDTPSHDCCSADARPAAADRSLLMGRQRAVDLLRVHRVVLDVPDCRLLCTAAGVPAATLGCLLASSLAPQELCAWPHLSLARGHRAAARRVQGAARHCCVHHFASVMQSTVAHIVAGPEGRVW